MRRLDILSPLLLDVVMDYENRMWCKPSGGDYLFVTNKQICPSVPVYVLHLLSSFFEVFSPECPVRVDVMQ